MTSLSHFHSPRQRTQLSEKGLSLSQGDQNPKIFSGLRGLGCHGLFLSASGAKSSPVFLMSGFLNGAPEVYMARLLSRYDTAAAHPWRPSRVRYARKRASARD